MMDKRLENIKRRHQIETWIEHSEELIKQDFDYLIQQAEKVQELERDRAEWEIESHTQNTRNKRLEQQFNDLYRKHFIKVERLEQQNQRYKETLEFYADVNNHGDTIEDFEYEPPIYHDNGEKARRALRGEST